MFHVEPGMSLRNAINAMCKQCIHDQIGGQGSWREQVKNCTANGQNGATLCPLYECRPKPRITAEQAGRDVSPETRAKMQEISKKRTKCRPDD